MEVWFFEPVFDQDLQEENKKKDVIYSITSRQRGNEVPGYKFLKYSDTDFGNRKTTFIINLQKYVSTENFWPSSLSTRQKNPRLFNGSHLRVVRRATNITNTRELQKNILQAIFIFQRCLCAPCVHFTHSGLFVNATLQGKACCDNRRLCPKQ